MPKRSLKIAADVYDDVSDSPQCVAENETLVEASKKFAQYNVDALPVCGEDETLKGMITEHDIVHSLARGEDPQQTKVGELRYDKPVTIGADDSLLSALETMAEQNVERRLPIIDGEKFIGVISTIAVTEEETIGTA